MICTTIPLNMLQPFVTYYPCSPFTSTSSILQVQSHSNVTFEIITLEEVGRRTLDTMTADDDEMSTAYSTMTSTGKCP